MFKWLKSLFVKSKSEKYIKTSSGMVVETDDPIMAEAIAKTFETGKIVTYSEGKMKVHDDDA